MALKRCPIKDEYETKRYYESIRDFYGLKVAEDFKKRRDENPNTDFGVILHESIKNRVDPDIRAAIALGKLRTNS
ncbi:MAG: hypothetical protein AABX65_03505 [Nanoarchaeota archaeon]